MRTEKVKMSKAGSLARGCAILTPISRPDAPEVVQLNLSEELPHHQHFGVVCYLELEK